MNKDLKRKLQIARMVNLKYLTDVTGLIECIEDLDSDIEEEPDEASREELQGAMDFLVHALDVVYEENHGVFMAEYIRERIHNFRVAGEETLASYTLLTMADKLEASERSVEEQLGFPNDPIFKPDFLMEERGIV